jgi:DNA-binding transcriptional ArsR family regulator
MLLISKSTNMTVKARFFRGFSDPSRLKILEIMRTGELTVGDIVERTGLSQSNVSNHLSCLRDCGLVTSEPRGKFIVYRLSDPRVEELLHLAETLLADVARGVYECTRYNVEKNS